MKKIFIVLIILFIFISLHSQYSGGKGTASDPFRISSEADLDRICENPSSYYILTGDIHLTETRQPLPYFQGYLDGQGYAIHNLVIDSGSEQSGLFGVLLGGKIENLRLVSGSVTGGDFTGALAGSNEAAIISNCSVEGFTIKGNREVGGIAGSNFGRIENSFTADSEIAGSHSVGGLTGSNYGGEIKNCYSTATVRGDYAGGLTGQHLIHGTISNSYVAGKVEGDIEDHIDNNAKDNNISGGLIGRNLLGKVKSSFWDSESSGQDESDGGTGLTTVKMMQQNTYPGDGPYPWDFNNVWAIEEWHTEPFSTYPYLRWQTAGPDPVGFEHNRPANYDDYYTEDGREFDIQDVNNHPWRWVSFPWISRDADDENFLYPRQTAEEALRPLANENLLQPIIDRVEFLHNEEPNWPDGELQIMQWNDFFDTWQPDEIGTFCSTRGYKLRFVEEDTHYLPLYGTRIEPDAEITLHLGELSDDPEPVQTPVYNWIGYFLTQSQPINSAFANIDHLILDVQTENGGRYLHNEEWIENHSRVMIHYGDMVKVALDLYVEQHDTIGFQWNPPPTRNEQERQPPVAKPEHFTVSYGPAYESIFIMDIADDEDVVEIGVYAGQECIGASVFKGEYPLEILAYTNCSHDNQNLSFVLYLQDDSYVRYDEVLIEEPDTRGYSRSEVTPLKNRFTLVKLDRTGGRDRSLSAEDAVEEKKHQVLSMRQNYPNPFSLRSGVRGHGQTSIAFAIPENMPVELSVYNIRGQLVRSLISGEVNRGDHTAVWDGRDSNNKKVGSGIYFYRLETAEETITRKMLIVR